MAGLSQEQTQALVGKLQTMRYEYTFPRAMYGVLEDVFYLVQTARWHLRRDGHAAEWREYIACHMYQLGAALRKAAEAAGEVEKATGFSGRELAEE